MHLTGFRRIPPISVKYLFVVLVECNPLHPLPRCLVDDDDEELLEDIVCADGIDSITRCFFKNLFCILFAAKSFNKSLGTRINNNFGTFLIKNLRTHGAILCVLGFR